MLTDNKRFLVRRSTTTGVEPTHPDELTVTSTEIPDSTWLSTDVMVGELFANVKDGKIWFKAEDETPILLGTTAGTLNFTDLGDVPSAYTGAEEYFVKVNAAGTGLEFVVDGGSGVGTFLELTDTPIDYTGMAGKVVAVNITEDAIEFIDAPAGELTGLSDVVADYTDGHILVADGTVYNSEDPADRMVMLEGTQIINGAKTFNDIPIFNTGVSIVDSIDFEGTTNISTITNIDEDFTATSHEHLVTSLAVDNRIASRLSGYVTLNTEQTIEGNKTFEGDKTTFNNPIVLNDCFYLGEQTTNGSWRFYASINGLKYEKLEAGVWNWKYTIQ